MSDAALRLADVASEFASKDWGFTGTRTGMTVMQHGHCRRVLTAGHPSVLRHGGAYGADTQIHALYRSEAGHKIEVWPADTKRVPLFLNQGGVSVKALMEPLARNEQIVNYSTLLLAAPHTQAEVQRSGTWFTIRYATRHAVPTLILWPDGKMSLARNKKLYRVI